MLKIIKTVALFCAFVPTAGLADAELAARDKARADLIAGIFCVYYINQGSVKFERAAYVSFPHIRVSR